MTQVTQPLRFECTGCGECCTRRGDYAYVYLKASDVTAMARHLRLLPNEFKRQYTFEDEYGWTQVVLEDRCVFLEPGTHRCKVYPVRPSQCRTFPFWRDLVRDGEWTQEARDMCEGVGRGRLYSIEEIETQMKRHDRDNE